MNRQLNFKIDIDSRKVTKYNDLIKVGDTVNLSITLTSKGNTVSLSGETVKLFLKKEDNKKVEQSVNISGNTITCTLSAQATTTVGQVVGELTFTGSNTKLTSSSFIFNVEGSVSNEVLEQSKDDVEILTKITDSITKANNTVETYKNNINAVAGTTEAVAALTEMKGLLSKAETNNTNLTAANTQATKNIKALTELGDATELAKDVETLKKQTLENNYTSIETDSVLTKLESVKDGFVDNMVIGGKTLQNLFNNDTPKYRDTTKLTYSISGDTVTANLNSDNSCWVGYDSSLNHAMLKTNTTYTFVFNMIDYPDTVTGIKINGGTATDIFATQFTLNESFKKGLNIGRFTTSSDASLKFGIIMMSNNAPSGSKFKFSKNVIILEGDWLNKQIPYSFTGIKSVGEDYVSSGKYLAKIKSVGKNLLDFKNGTSRGGATLTILENGINVKGSAQWSGIHCSVYLKANTKYILNCNFKKNITEGLSYAYADLSHQSGAFIKNISSSSGFYSFTVPYTGKYLIGLYGTGTDTKCDCDFTEIQLEEGTIRSTYEPYQSDTTEIQLKEPLRGLPNGVKDTIDFEKGIVTRNVGKLTLNQNNNWVIDTNNVQTNTIRFYIPFSSLSNIKPSISEYIQGNMICDKFINLSTYSILTSDKEGTGKSTGALSVNILKSKLNGITLDAFKIWLTSNPITIYTDLATPTTEEIEIKDTLQTFKDGYIQLENSITPVVNLDFSTNYPSIVASLKEKLDALIDRMATVEAYITEKASESITENI